METTKQETDGEAIAKLQPEAFKKLRRIVPSGALHVRKLKSGGVKLYWVYNQDGKTRRAEIGVYDGKLPPRQMTPKDGRWSIEAAAAEASRLAVGHQCNKLDGGHAGLVKAKAEAKAAAAAAAKAATEQAEAEAHRRSKYTLAELLKAYWLHLEALGRASHREAKGVLTNHAIKAWPSLAALPAAEINDEQVADMMRRLIEQGKGRTANKLRSYLSAAYRVAQTARSNPVIPVAFKAFAIKHNPAAETAANSAANKAAKKALNTDEMRVYWNCIKDIQGVKGVALKLHLLTGGQRIEQLVRLKSADIEADRITIFDGKGRPGPALRPNVLPLIPAAAEAIKELSLSGEYALTTGDGTVDIFGSTLSKWAKKAVGSRIENFTAKRLRSGAETLLASIGISDDIRGRLQSHGISGVQDRHYNDHKYVPEKRAALEALFRELTGASSGNVVPIKAAA